MNIILNYSNYPVIKDSNKSSIFLAGPTPRSSEVISWRNEAINILKQLDYNGIIYIPECDFLNSNFDYTTQVEWEWEAMEYADIILFWVPRSKELPGFTTNVEFGYWLGKNRQKVYYGRPDEAINNRYLDALYFKLNKRQPFNSLFGLIYDIIHVLRGN